MYAEKYRPRKLSEVVGQPKALRELLSWFNTWSSQKKASMLHGKSGVGKTCTIYALKEEFDLDLIELNTSDNRNFENVMRIVGNASNSHSLEGKRRLILLDEVDNISGREDRGGMRAINKIIDTTKVPIVLIVNEYWQISQSLREKCKLIAYQSLRSPSILKVLRRIRDSENLGVRDSELLELAKNAGGDLRAAINDLESFYPEMRNLRDERASIFSALVPLFKNQSAKVREKFFNVEKTPEEVLWWITENLPKVYEPQDLRKAFYYASRSDVFLGRVRRRQYYKFWSYANDLMTSGIS
ncbi:MAG: replication factor C large subunit, partial [Candidatus Methanofastidiosia archaeon]